MPRHAGSSAGFVLAGCLAAGLAAGFGEGAEAAPVNRTGLITKFTGVDEIVEACTTSSAFVNMPSMSRSFSVSGTTNQAVAVTFQGASSLSGEQAFDTGFIRLTIDGVVQGPGGSASGDVPMIGVGERGTHGFTWQSRPLTPGTHTARIQWRTDLGSSFCVDARSLVVLHR